MLSAIADASPFSVGDERLACPLDLDNAAERCGVTRIGRSGPLTRRRSSLAVGETVATAAIGQGFPEVLLAAQAGAEWALSQLFTAHNPSLRRYLDGRARGFGDDLAQEVWIAAARTIRTFEGDEPALRAWLFAIARTKLIDHGRRTARRPADVTDPHEFEVAQRGVTPADRLTAREAVDELLAGLSAEQADILLLRVVGGFNVDETAALIGKRPGAVRVAQHRALRRAAAIRDPRGVTR